MSILNLFKSIFGKKDSTQPVKKKKRRKSKPSSYRLKPKTKKEAKKKTANKTKKKPQKSKLSPKKATAKKKIESKEKEIGTVTHYFGKISVGVIKLKDALKVGDKIHIKGAHDDFYQTITSMQVNHKNISFAAKGKEVGIKVIKRVHQNDKVYKIKS